jgi:hypothetical protein
VLRGCVYEPEVRSVSAHVEEEFGFAEMSVVSFPDLYGGKIVAALDRPHPRDLFDVRDLFAKEGIDDKVRKAFIVYLLSHDRPMAEVLAPQRRDISAEYQRGYEGMVDEPVTLDELLKAREDLIAEIVGRMPEQHKRFLISDFVFPGENIPIFYDSVDKHRFIRCGPLKGTKRPFRNILTVDGEWNRSISDFCR